MWKPRHGHEATSRLHLKRATTLWLYQMQTKPCPIVNANNTGRVVRHRHCALAHTVQCLHTAEVAPK